MFFLLLHQFFFVSLETLELSKVGQWFLPRKMFQTKILFGLAQKKIWWNRSDFSLFFMVFYFIYLCVCITQFSHFSMLNGLLFAFLSCKEKIFRRQGNYFMPLWIERTIYFMIYRGLYRNCSRNCSQWFFTLHRQFLVIFLL